MGSIHKSLQQKKLLLSRIALLGDRSNPGLQLAANAAVVLAWAWLYRAVYPYLGVIFTRQEFRTNQIILVGALALIAIQIRRGDVSLRLTAAPHLHLPALALLLSSSALFLGVERFLDINTLSAALCGLSAYGLLGLWMSPRRWQQGLPAALLLIGALPFGEHMQTFIGYPVRVYTAEAVRLGLSTLGVKSASVETILVFENGLTQVDLPCSGVKSLWTGGLFLLSATWIERRPINLRWLLAGLGFALLLLAANLGRVAILVGVGQAAGWRLLAEMLHVPLGVLGFVLACAAAVYLLRWAGRHTEEQPAEQGEAQAGSESGSTAGLPRPAWLTPLLAGSILAMALLYTPRPVATAAQASPTWSFAPEMNVERWPFTTGEREWLAEGGAASADRWRFQWRGTSGSLLFVSSPSWRGQHRPERCFQVYGLAITGSQPHLATAGFPLRVLSLGDSRGDEVYTAAYWLQSQERTTDDYASRIWADLEPGRERWVLVTILFDQVVDPRAGDVEQIYSQVHQAVQNSLVGGVQP